MLISKDGFIGEVSTVFTDIEVIVLLMRCWERLSREFVWLRLGRTLRCFVPTSDAFTDVFFLHSEAVLILSSLAA